MRCVICGGSGQRQGMGSIWKRCETCSGRGEIKDREADKISLVEKETARKDSEKKVKHESSAKARKRG